MKLISVFVIATLVGLKVYSQHTLNNSTKGYYFDINHNFIPGYCDQDYDPKEQLYVKFVIGEEFTPGYYYNRTLNKTSGLLLYSQLSASPTFAADNNSEEYTLSPKDCSGYVIGADSFGIITNFNVERLVGGFQSNRREFAEVIEKVGNFVFYKHTRTGMNNIVFTYLAKSDTSDEYISFPKIANKFKETCFPVFGEFESLKNQIEKGIYKSDDIPVMAKILKYKQKFDHQERIYYTSSWDEVDDVHKSSYYAVIESVKDSIFHFKYYTNNDKLIYEGSYSSFYPDKKTGEFKWFYPDGMIRKTINYQNNNPHLTTIFYPNGSKQVEYYTDYVSTFYQQAFGINGEELIDGTGNGVQLLYDSLLFRQITIEYGKHRLKSAFYIDQSGRKIYLQCEKNAEISNFKQFQKQLAKEVEYPLNSIRNYEHGIVMVKCIIEPTGLVSDIQIVKGLNPECDSLVLNNFAIMGTKKTWTAAMIAKQKVTQEIVIPVDFAISGFSRYRNNYNYFWMNQNMMMNNNMMQPQLPPNIRTSW